MPQTLDFWQKWVTLHVVFAISFESPFFLFEYSISQLTNMNEQEEVLLEQFVTLPQLKQVITDRDELVKSIEELASKMSKH